MNNPVEVRPKPTVPVTLALDELDQALLLQEVQVALSYYSGVSEDTITKIENGHRVARPSTIRKLAKGLGVESQELRGTPVVPKALTPLG
jgi:transcriptional regulator with XRE-family HTH domain